MSKWILLLVGLLLTISQTSFAQSRTPGPLQGVDAEQLLDAQVPLHTVFKNEQGKEVPLSDLMNEKPVILSLVYYECPMLCTQVLNGLITSLRPMNLSAGKDFNILTISFDPRETPALATAKKAGYLKEYARPDAEKGWHFLTGEKESIDSITKAVGFKYAWDASTSQFAHASVIMVLTPRGKISRYFYGIDYSSRDLRWALIDASKNKIGSIADRILLYCFHYDPSLGKYSLHALNLIRMGGIATVLILGAFILKSLNRKNTDEQQSYGQKAL